MIFSYFLVPQIKTMPRKEYEIIRVAEEIERYLQTHRHAADTLEGIAKWWLLQQRYQDSTDCVHNALVLLTERGLVEKITTLDGKTIYMSSISKTCLLPPTVSSLK